MNTGIVKFYTAKKVLALFRLMMDSRTYLSCNCNGMREIGALADDQKNSFDTKIDFRSGNSAVSTKRVCIKLIWGNPDYTIAHLSLSGGDFLHRLLLAEGLYGF